MAQEESNDSSTTRSSIVQPSTDSESERGDECSVSDDGIAASTTESQSDTNSTDGTSSRGNFLDPKL